MTDEETNVYCEYKVYQLCQSNVETVAATVEAETDAVVADAIADEVITEEDAGE